MSRFEEIKRQWSPGCARLSVVHAMTADQDAFTESVLDAHPCCACLLIGLEINGPFQIGIGDQIMG